MHTHIHTHPFNSLFSGTTWASRYQKGKTNLDFTEARDSEWQWHHLGHMQVCTLLQTDNHESTSPLNFLQAGCPSCRPTNSVKALTANFRKATQKNESVRQVAEKSMKPLSQAKNEKLKRFGSIILHKINHSIIPNMYRSITQIFLKLECNISNHRIQECLSYYTTPILLPLMPIAARPIPKQKLSNWPEA